MIPTPASFEGSSYNPYDLLRIYTYYRSLLGSLLVLMFQLGFAVKAIGNDGPSIFFYTSLSYTAISFFTLVMLWQVKFQPSQLALFATLLIDIVAITLMMHASGGAQSGLGYLLLVAIAAGGIMLRERITILLAAIATIAIISEGLFRYFFIALENKTLLASGSLGALAFLTAWVFQYLTQKIRLSSDEARKQSAHAAHLQKLAQLIIERMRTGIVVFNRDNEIELFNHSALTLLGLPPSSTAINLAAIPELAHKFSQWKQQHKDISPFVKIDSDDEREIKVNFAYLNPEQGNETLIFLEDARALTQQAQQLKLASLGRLTASIAHEIRNPLGAISHASQLLAESDNINPSDQRLLDIIHNHSKRVNQIIENILQLSRRSGAAPERVVLAQWLPLFLKDYRASKDPKMKFVIDWAIITATDGDTLCTNFDPSQLQQVLTNLCDNGLRYTQAQEDRADLRIEIGEDSYQQPFIRVIDYGPGIDAETRKHLFEPFFTTENTGSGLGLYICKELCEANQALLNYQRTEKNESCFYIQLAHPEKAQ